MPQVCFFVWERLRPKSELLRLLEEMVKQKTIVYANNKNINKLSAKNNVLFLGLVFLTKQIAEEKITPKKTEVNL